MLYDTSHPSLHGSSIYTWPTSDRLQPFLLVNSASLTSIQLRFPHLYTTEFLFPDRQHKQKHMSSAQATVILKRLTQRFPTPMSLSIYRQSALAIAKRYIKQLVQAANFYKPKAASDPVKMIATGVGHHPRVLLTEYTIDSALPILSRLGTL
jgi:hypothetical protein